MEELLQPWIHFVPIADDLSDVEEKVEWVRENDKAAQQIAHAGTLWISDLIFHPKARADDESIFDEMLVRYKQHFAHNPALYIETLLD